MSDHFRLFMRQVAGIVFIFSFSVVYADSFDDATGPQPSINLADQNYQQLKAYIPIFERAAANPWPAISTHKLIKIGTKGEVVELIRQRLRATNDLPSYFDNDGNRYDENLAEAVKQFQLRHGLKDDGVIGKNTLIEMNITPTERLKQIELNMQRWAALSSQLSNRFVMVNIPDFELYLFENNKAVLTMKTIVGRPSRPTPELSSVITRLVLNPYWNVPIRLANRDIVPKVLRNPSYLDDMHIKIFDNQESDASEINPDEVNWRSAAENGFPYHFRQDPGNDNALGLIKFEFQNSKDIYLHDTPAKSLFEQDLRTYSSGCIRLEDAFALVPYLMDSSTSWDEMRMEDILASGKTTYIRADDPLPIFITYLTAWVDDAGLINFRQDIYGKDDPTRTQAEDPEQPEEH